MEKLTLDEIDKLPRDYITVFEASAAMGINPQTFYRHVSELPFPLFKVGRRYRIPKKPFIDYMRSGKTG